MADVELVIKIPEELYELYKGRPPMLGDAGMDMIAQSIANGTPLPKGHGRLIDVSDIEWAKFTRETSRYEEVKCVDWDVVENAPTIIEADKEESK